MLIVRDPTGRVRCYGFVFNTTAATKGAASIRLQLGLPVTPWRSLGGGARIQAGSQGAGWFILDWRLHGDPGQVRPIAQQICSLLGGPTL